MGNQQTTLNKKKLDEVVDLLKKELSDPEMRKLNNRAIQAKVFQIPQISQYMQDLRLEEEKIRQKMLSLISRLIYKLQEHSLDATLARAGILSDSRVHAGTSLDDETEFDLICLDAKERLYMILQKYGWLQDFFKFYPQHFYENSFQFVERIPPKKLPVKVKVVGLGIGGSLAVSGLKKNGIEVIGYDKRERNGPRSVTSRFQNASWRAYDIAEHLLDEEAFNHLVKYQQRITVNYDNGTSKVMTSDRVQIILGDAIDSALESAERFGAELCFNADSKDFCKVEEGQDMDKTEIVALFAGAHTAGIVDGLKEEMSIHSWKDISSDCKLWLEILPSKKKEAYTTRNVEVGAEKWHFCIESARNTVEDIVRIRDNLIAQKAWNMRKLETSGASKEEIEAEEAKYALQMKKIQVLLDEYDSNEEKKEEAEEKRFDYIFTNCPSNEHNDKKKQAALDRGNLVIDGGYRVDVQIADKSVIDNSNFLSKFNAGVIVTGGDATVNPNPMAAYGATLACEFAASLVNLAIAHGHINAITKGLEGSKDAHSEWITELEELKVMTNQFYDAHGRSENYFQWIQTLICNLYSLPPQTV